MPTWLTNLLKWLFPPKPTPPTLPPPPVVVEPPAPPPPPEPEPVGRLMLWSVGINAYQSSPLQGCVNDSVNLGAYLAPKGAEAHYLHDREATGTAMESFWTRAMQEAGPNDTLVIHYSGHGSNGPSGLPDDPGQCLVSADMRPFYASRLGKILSMANPETTVVVVLDCCHSETGTRLLGSAQYKVPKSIPWSELNTEWDRRPTWREHRAYNLAALARSPENGIVEFAACEANDVTYDAHIGDQIQGCATRAWIDAAVELDAESHTYTVAEYQARVRTKLPNNEFPNWPQLQASEWQRSQVMWRP